VTVPTTLTTLAVETPSDGVTLVRLIRPERLNAIDEVMVGELHRLCAALGAEPACRVVVLTGAGRGSCGRHRPARPRAGHAHRRRPGPRPAAVPGADGVAATDPDSLAGSTVSEGGTRRGMTTP
jgi:hypothetical protein